MKTHVQKKIRKNGARLLFALALISPVTRAASQDSEKKSGNAVPAEDYKIGTADVLSVSVIEAPEFGGKFRVSDSGAIEIPAVSSPIQAEGQTPGELARSIRQALINAKQLRDPHVTVFVDEYHGRVVTVLGAVAKPSTYPLTKHTNILEALSLAGGALPNSGNTVTVVRGSATAEATNSAPGAVQIVQMSDLVSGKDLAANIEVRNGDVINVSSAQVVYVVGAVTKPGGFPMTDVSSGVSVVQAVALAEGLKTVASHHALIVRQSTSESARLEIPVDLGQMMAGKTADVPLAPNDILYVPKSGTKMTLKAMGDVAAAAVNGLAFYGIGYRVGGVK